MKFKLLNNSDIDKAYSIICCRVEDLLLKGIKQYERPYPPKELFIERQNKKNNYALYEGSQLAVIVTLIPNYRPEGWLDDINKNNFIWLTTLFSSEKYKGQNLGCRMLNEIKKLAERKKFSFVFLDCYLGNGFLLDYYLKQGFTEIKRKIVKYPNREFEAVLMEKKIYSPGGLTTKFQQS